MITGSLFYQPHIFSIPLHHSAGSPQNPSSASVGAPKHLFCPDVLRMQTEVTACGLGHACRTWQSGLRVIVVPASLDAHCQESHELLNEKPVIASPVTWVSAHVPPARAETKSAAAVMIAEYCIWIRVSHANSGSARMIDYARCKSCMIVKTVGL